MSSSQSQNSLFRQQQRLYRSSIYLTKTKIPTLYTSPATTITTNESSNKGRKRRASFEDEEMMNSEPLEEEYNPNSNSIDDNLLHTIKRNRLITKKELPIGKLLATLDKEKLIELINDLVDSNPYLRQDLEAQLNIKPSPL